MSAIDRPAERTASRMVLWIVELGKSSADR
jgi:hypothetical protein